jgi:hypothetical protein
LARGASAPAAAVRGAAKITAKISSNLASITDSTLLFNFYQSGEPAYWTLVQCPFGPCTKCPLPHDPTGVLRLSTVRAMSSPQRNDRNLLLYLVASKARFLMNEKRGRQILTFA